MAGYRLLCLDSEDHIQHREDFDAQDDAAAIAYAQRKYGNHNCEIWELGRRVVRLAAAA